MMGIYEKIEYVTWNYMSVFGVYGSILYLKFKLSNQKTVFVPCDGVIFRGVASQSADFRASHVI